MYPSSPHTSALRDFAHQLLETLDQLCAQNRQQQETLDQLHAQISLLPDLANLMDEATGEQTGSAEAHSDIPVPTGVSPDTNERSSREETESTVSSLPVAAKPTTISETVEATSPSLTRPVALTSSDPHQDTLLAQLWQHMTAAHLEDPLLIQAVVFERGYYSADTPIADYDPDFIQDCLLAAWPQVCRLALEKLDDTPF